MGDPRRFSVVAAFVRWNFPSARRIADVAGGKGYLALALSELGCAATVIDPRLNRKTYGQVRRAAWMPFRRLIRPFNPGMATGFDLLVGLHPDGATEPLARAATVRPVLLVPC